jgi:hypothetical protein
VSACPVCGEPAERGQLVCVNCGTRLALRPRSPYTGPPRSALPALALLLAVVVIGAGALGFVLSELTNDSGGGGAATAGGGKQPAPTAGAGQPQTGNQAGATSTAPGQSGVPQPPRRSPLLKWPAGLSAHTVVLVTTSDRAAASRIALEAARSGVEAGLLRSDDYDLGTGLWIVFAGRFDTRASAIRQASNLAKRYPGAYAQLVKPVKRTR